MAHQQESSGADYETWLNERIGNQGNPEALARFEFVVTQAQGSPLHHACWGGP